MKERLKVAVKGPPPKKAATILASVHLPAQRRRKSPYDDKAATAPRPPTRLRKGDKDDTPSTSKPVLGR